jgi:hypothetical protein
MAVITRRGAKPAPKGTAVKRTGSTKGARRSTGAQKTASRKATARASTRTNRSSTTDIPQSQLDKILAKLEEAADLRTELFEQHREAVDVSNRLILDAESKGVPVHMIVEAANIARQQFYKLLQDAESGKLANGRQPAGRKPGTGSNKPAAKPAAAKRQVARKAPAAKTSGGKLTLRRKG